MATLSQIKNLTTMRVPEWNITLNGHNLFSKHGFNDGDILDGMLEYDETLCKFDDALYDLNPRVTFFDDIALIALVELFLLPKFDRPLTLYHANYLHNPCRVEEDEWWPQEHFDFPLPEVVVEGQTVSCMFYSLKDVFEAWQAGKPGVFPECLKQTALIFSALAEYPVAICDNQLERIVCWPNPLLISSNKQS